MNSNARPERVSVNGRVAIVADAVGDKGGQTVMKEC